jgi:hypothetical protein
MGKKTKRVLLESPFGFTSPALLFGRASLLTDRIELSGWRLAGRYLRRIPIEKVLQVDSVDDGNLVVWLSVGEVVRLRIEHAGLWKEKIDERLHALRVRAE